MADTADIVVIGGGCHGTSIAWQLARRGAGKVVLLEKSGIASGATQWSSANIRLHYQIETLARMALYGREMFRNFEERVGGESGWRNNGYVVLLPEEEIEPARVIIEMQQRIGIDARMVSVDEIAEMLPGMSLDGVAGGCAEPDSGHADGALTANSFAEAARREGAELRIGPEVGQVTAIESPGGGVRVITSNGVIESGTAVLAGGFRSAGLLAPHGVELPITPVRHTIAIVERVEAKGLDDSHATISDRVQLGYYRPSGPGLTLIGAHDPLEGEIDADVETTRRPQAEPTALLAGRFWNRFPGQAEARLREGYTGVYDCTPDFQPALGPVQAVPGLYIAAGFSGHGFKLSPAVGHLMADWILEGEPSFVDLSMFNVERFGRGELIESGGGYESRTLA
ncbi:MAG: FAD-binding oxidoreductase [Chloroflexi bacterium]|nr:FAD-binding oxidoreductase [Chloroflexota bacterium]